MPGRTKLTLLLSVCLVASCAIAFNSFAQNPSSSKPTNKNQSDQRSLERGQQAPAPRADFSQNTWELPDDYDKTKNPVGPSDDSIAKGKELYLNKDKGNCIFCHGETGSGNEANFPKLRRRPADISSKERMSQLTDGEVFWKISKGINQIMPAGEKRMTEEERWNVVNYIRTLAKEQ